MRLDLRDWDKEVEIQLIAIYEYAAGWTWQRREENHYNLWFALEASGSFDFAGKAWPLASGSIFLFPPGTRPAGQSAGVMRTINFTAHFHAKGRTDKMLRRFVRETGPVRLRNSLWASHLCRFLSEVFYLDAVKNRALVLSGLELLLRSMLHERVSPTLDPVGEKLIQVIERIRRNPAASYTVLEMAAGVNLSPAHFARRFKDITGFAPNRFLVEERIARAESYLRETDLSVQEIAASLGYRDVYFFSRQFRRFRGVPPTGIRRELPSKIGSLHKV